MTLINQIGTISGIILGSVWIGIGIPWGNDIYKIFIRPRFKKQVELHKKIKVNWKP